MSMAHMKHLGVTLETTRARLTKLCSNVLFGFFSLPGVRAVSPVPARTFPD